jgi:hypothetical protein
MGRTTILFADLTFEFSARSWLKTTLPIRKIDQGSVEPDMLVHRLLRASR